jgi:serine/threonine protein kinase
MSELISDQFTFKEIEIYRDQRLGSGAYGVVCKAKCDLLPCAAKLLHPTFVTTRNFAVEKFKQECSFLASLKHPHIVQFLGIHTEPSSGQLALLLELMDGNLTSLLQRYQSIDQKLPYHTLINISHDVSLALQYLHSNGIIHRDLSSNNVLLLGECRAKITDFGMSRYTQSSSTMSSLTQVPGCPLYMPPEAWVTPPIYSEKLDVFSLGVLLVQMITCRQPNPGPLEVLIPDERSPTGFMKLPVSEIERRNEDISLISSNHPLKSAILQCLLDKSNDRPTSRDMCHTMESLKSSSQYKESNEGQGLRQLSHDSCASSDTGISSSQLMSDSLDRRITERDSEIEKMREKITSLEDEIKSLKKQLEDKDELIEQLKNDSNQKESTPIGTHPETTLDIEKIELKGLSPELLAILSKAPETAPLNLEYKVNEGTVCGYSQSHFVEKGRHLKIFIQIYEHFFNMGKLRVGFHRVPDDFPKELIPKILQKSLKSHEDCYFEYNEGPNVIKVISKSPDLFKLSSQLIQDLLSFSISLPGDRKLSIKQGNMLDETVNIYVASAQPDLSIRYGTICGLSAMNVSSHFELQKHCDEYVKKHSHLKLTECAVTPSGGLKCQWVMHSIIPIRSHIMQNSTDRLHEMLSDTFTNIIVKAEKLKVASLAIPPLGFSLLENSDGIDLAAVCLMDTFLSYKFKYLKDIRIVILKDNIYTNVLDIFIDKVICHISKAYKSIVDNSSK